MNKTKNRQTITRIASFTVYAVLALALVLAVFAQTTPAAAKTCKFKHKVKAGESLISIGQMYQYDWREIAEASDLKEPYVLSVGDVLCIPGGTKPAETTTTTTTNASGTQTTATAKSSPSLTTGAAPNSVYVKVEGFPKNTPYAVRIQGLRWKVEINPNDPADKNKNTADAYICPIPNKFGIDPVFGCQIGRFRTDKTGLFEGWFRVPVQIVQDEKMTVCVKNMLNDNLSCGDYENPYYTMSSNLKESIVAAQSGCAKWAR